MKSEAGRMRPGEFTAENHGEFTADFTRQAARAHEAEWA